MTGLLKKYNIQKEENLDQLTEGVKQNVSAKTQRLSRCRERQNQYHQNKLFSTDCKKFYNHLMQTYPNVKYAPDNQQVENFWKEIYGEKV
jgi:membrane protein insertase Oxa1/YidC/SpoIIIJ